MTAWVEPTEVVLSEDGWMLRFAKFSPMKSIFVVPAGSGVVDLSIWSVRPCFKLNVLFRDVSEIVDLYGFILDGLWWVENNVCGVLYASLAPHYRLATKSAREFQLGLYFNGGGMT